MWGILRINWNILKCCHKLESNSIEFNFILSTYDHLICIKPASAIGTISVHCTLTAKQRLSGWILKIKNKTYQTSIICYYCNVTLFLRKTGYVLGFESQLEFDRRIVGNKIKSIFFLRQKIMINIGLLLKWNVEKKIRRENVVNNNAMDVGGWLSVLL